MWLTTADEAQKLARQPQQAPAGRAAGDEAVTIDTSKRFQEMHGFGAAMTDASAILLSNLPDSKRKAIMAELFGRANSGLGLSFTRLTVGASDFSTRAYSYDDTPGNVPDPELRHFSIEPAKKYVLPRTREALAINPDLLVMISPWSAPAWMKTSRSLITGQLQPQYYQPFANYLARTVEGFGREGVPVSMITIQNEPDFEPDDYPGMRVNSPDRAVIIGGYVGPTFRTRGLKAQILDYDHNWDDPQMPLTVLRDPRARQYVSGVAWHCYEGDVPAQSRVHDAYPAKDAWVTECSGGQWSPKYAEVLGWMTDKLIIGASNHWSRGTLLWNLALDPKHGPHTGGCGDCRGVVTIDPSTGAIIRNVEYYVLGHASRFVLPGAYRVATAKRGEAVEASAFINPDGTRVAILHRKSGTGPLTIALDGERYEVALPVDSVATLRWKARSGGK
ncbi:glycoside hydrolase family 30 protein [Sphingomonas segetis]|jgi:glucosylceramidase|uniref:glycoside hydrolase family 30 protein n=1 Tax=Sphingomonas segetis TaxID=1104779 RepID=UPI0012D2B717|nr:glycoside hydrolase family 30 beta sandwich domain-containing protein [Sphingomonas segetis]